MSTDQTTADVRQGLDLKKFQTFRQYARTNADEVQFVLEAKGTYEGRVAHTRAETGPYTLGGQRIDRLGRQYVHHLGAHREVEQALGFDEPTDREEATEVVLAALTGCINTAVSSSAVARGIELSRLETHVSLGWDPFVFLHLRDTDESGGLVNQFESLRVELRVEGDDLTEDDLAYLRRAIRRSAVFNLLTLGHPSTRAVELAGSESR